MMEKTDSMRDDYAWAMKISFMKSDQDDSWKQERRKQSTPPTNDFGVSSHLGQKYTFFDEGSTKMMASLVPDEVIYNISDYSKREFDGCLLIGDVSGFTELCEKYNKAGRGGPSKLTQVLNAYIGAMVQEILSHSGDVLKFSGDAFIALWKETDHLSLKDAVHEAIDCSLVIQKNYGNYQTDIDVVVRVKLAVSCGRMCFSLIGTPENSHYLMVGSPIFEIKEAENLTKAGEIIITAKVSHYITINEYLIDLMPDGIHAKVLGVGPNWRNIRRRYEAKEERYSLISADNQQQATDESETSESDEEEVRQTRATVGQDLYALRPAVNFACRMKTNEELRKFILAPVMRGIDAEEPLEYLTEIRQVVILFINCKVEGNLKASIGLDVSNEVYTSVCDIVKESNGCVNKINYFDKDLMLLVVFGLRGFKNELECRVALECARLVFWRLQKVNYINSVSIGVTTGKTYCGVFGHSLRREYTVIGLTVNKAARMMVAYPNKVTCDRETFLHSKLESSNFTLQEYKYLKGIVTPGPIYEFKEVEKSQEAAFRYNAAPLLGRDQEVDLYSTLLDQARGYSAPHNYSKMKFCNMLIIQGVHRQGKTRMLEELMFLTDSTVPMIKFSLSRAEYDVPYQTIRMIFARFLRRDNDSEGQRMEIIRSSFVSSELKSYLCLINAVFKVNFSKSADYSQLSPKQKYDGLLKIFLYFAKSVFNTLFVIVIDDAEYVDDESWLLIERLLDLNCVFFLVTMGSQKSLSTLALQVLRNERMKAIELKGIEKWFHLGLACQMLHVDGIPPELEKTIQIKSNGNPGWIESFLVTLKQSGGITIVEMTRREANETGVVIAPLYMIIRLSQEEITLYLEIMGEETFNEKEKVLDTRWKMFIESCRESFPDLAVTRHFADKLSKSDKVMIAMLNPSFNLEDVDSELIMDVIILKTFDALTTYEQLLLKCSSILGDTFPRDMLLYIMSTSAMRITALAVKKLFENHVLCCARGNFIEGGLNFKDRLINPNDDLSIKCECKGLIINENNADLPKYASCGYLRFRSSVFRETTYNLLTENQKIEFHEKAIRFLERETRRCRSCGHGYFNKQMGTGRLDPLLRPAEGKKKRRMVRSVSLISDSDSAGGRFDHTSSFMSFESLTSPREASRRDFYFQPGSVVDSASALITGSQDTGTYSFGRRREDTTLMRNFSNIDYSQCSCLLILNSFYSYIIQHCKGAGLGEKVMNATIEYSYVCIECNNIPQAIRILEEALVLLDGPMKDQIELDWMISLKRGKCFALLGHARHQLKDEDSHIYLMNALKCYGVSFPKKQISARLARFHHKLRHNLRLRIWKDTFWRKYNDDVAEYCNNVAECLNFLCDYYLPKGKLIEAELAAIWSLSLLLKTETDFEKLCIAYGNVILVTSLRGEHSFSMALEVCALKMCHRKRTFVEFEELRAISVMYYAITCSRFRRAEMFKFTFIAYTSWRLAISSKNIWTVISLLPQLAHVILTKKQMLEFGSIIQEVSFFAEQEHDVGIKTWYYAMAMQMHIETGLSVELFSTCLKFMLGEGKDPKRQNRTATNRLVIFIWLWEIRNGNWESAIAWQRDAWSLMLHLQVDLIANLISSLYLIEGLIVYMVSKMDMKNLYAVDEAHHNIMRLFKILGHETSRCKFIKPRLFHMKGYYQVARYNDLKNGLNWLSKAKKWAERYQNDLELKWIRQSEMSWTRKLPREDADFWKDHADEDNVINFRDIEYMDKFIQYTLPLPIYN